MLPSPTPSWLWRLDAHHRLMIAVSMAIAIFVLLPPTYRLSTRSVLAWDVGAVSLLILSWSVIFTAHPQQIRQRAQTDDFSRIVVAVLVSGSACVSLLAIARLLDASQTMPPAVKHLNVLLAIVAVVSSWLLVHTGFALRYAHVYYQPAPKGIGAGLDFPGEAEPDYLDFAYFSLVIGMAAQVSDVAVRTRSLRRLVLLHSVLSFAFNVVVIALSINILSQFL